MTGAASLTLVLWAALLTTPVKADIMEVDLELVLLVDVSHSMTEHELEIQRQGYAAALRSEEVFTAIQSGLLQRIALTYIEWAGTQEIIVDWTLLETRADLEAVADILTTRYDLSVRRTSISEALIFGGLMMDNNAFKGLRRVIDVSGDGPNNKGRSVLTARDTVLSKSITINGLPLMTNEEFVSFWDIEDLDVYYRNCVIGGPGSFMIPVTDWQDFEEAVRRKLVLEIAGLPPQEQVIPAQYTPGPSYDCLVGEKLWDRYQHYWSEP
ncbi:MAG: DUF1194 domain-containing protein [Pseudomonadota bacterium]